MNELSHLEAIEQRLAIAKSYVAKAKNEKEKGWREHNVKIIEKERQNEIDFLAKKGIVVKEMSDEEILKELGL